MEFVICATKRLVLLSHLISSNIISFESTLLIVEEEGGDKGVSGQLKYICFNNDTDMIVIVRSDISTVKSVGGRLSLERTLQRKILKAERKTCAKEKGGDSECPWRGWLED